MTEALPLDVASALAFVALALAAAVACYRWAWCAPALVVASAPFAWYHQAGPTEITVSKAIFIGAAIGVASLLARDEGRRARALAALRANRAVIPLAALAIWSAASAAWAGTPSEAIRDALKWIWYAGAFALTIVSVEDPADGVRVLIAMFSAAAVVSIDGLWQSATSAPAGFVAPNGAVVGRIAATLEGPNQFGAYLETVIGPLLAVLLFARLPKFVIVAASLLLGVLVADLLLTYSRGALWASTGALVFLAIAYVRLRREGKASAPAIVAAVAACVALVVVPIAHSSIGAAGWQHELLTSGMDDGTDSTARRRELWTCAFQLFEQHPIVGVGAGNFADAKQACGPALAGPEHFNANEWYLETAADLGIVGVFALFAFLFELVRAWRSPALWGDATALGAYAVVVAFVLHGFVDDVMTYPKAALSFFVVAALICTRASAGFPRGSTRPM